MKPNFLPSKEQLFWLAVLATMAVALAVINTAKEPFSILTAALLTGFASTKLWRTGFKELPIGCTIATVLLSPVAVYIMASTGKFTVLVADSISLVLSIFVWTHGLFAVWILVVYGAARIAMLGANKASS